MPFNGTFVAQISEQIIQRGVKADTVYKALECSPQQLHEEEFLIKHESYNSLLDLAKKQTKDLFLGIHMSRSLNLHAAGLVMQIAQHSATFKEALLHACKYAMLGCQNLPMRMEETEYAYELVYSYDQRWRMHSEWAFQQTLEGSIYFLLKQYQALTNKRFSPVKVTLDYQPESSFRSYQEWFNCQVFIRDNRNSIVFRKQDLDTPIITADFSLLNHLLKFADQRLLRYQQRETPVEQVARVIVNTLPDRARVEDVARELNLSVRTLQRRLKDEETSFRDLLESILLDFARQKIKTTKNISLSELAHLLNYSDLSAFSRAYRKHFGEPPTKHIRKTTASVSKRALNQTLRLA